MGATKFWLLVIIAMGSLDRVPVVAGRTLLPDRPKGMVRVFRAVSQQLIDILPFTDMIQFLGSGLQGDRCVH